MRHGEQPPDEAWPDELRNEALAVGVVLSPETLSLFDRYMAELLRWKARMNLTGFGNARAIARDGFLDSLACLQALPLGALRIVDIGSGAGFPGIPLKLARPDLEVTLIEANRRRHSFLAHVCRTVGLGNARCLHGRAEAMALDPALRGAFDAAFARAVRKIEAAASLAAPFLRPGGIFVGHQGAATPASLPFMPGYGPGARLPVPQGDRPGRSGRALLVYPRAP
jgi:16S rRNA (guanine527-N7)-methyltransferase